MGFSLTRIESSVSKETFFETLNFYILKNGDVALLVNHAPVSTKNSGMYEAYIFKNVSKVNPPFDCLDVYIPNEEYTYKECVFGKIPSNAIDRKFSGILIIRPESLMFFERSNDVVLTSCEAINADNTVPGFILQSDNPEKVNTFNFNFYIKNAKTVSFHLLVECQ